MKLSTRLRFSYLVVAITICLLHSLAIAQIPPSADGFSVSPKELLARAAALQDSGDGGFAILLSEDEFTFREDGSATHRRYVEGKAFTQEAAEDWGSVSVYWEPWHEDKPQIRARVVDDAGREYALDQATLAEAAANDNIRSDNLYNDLMLLRGPLPGIAAGAVRVSESIVVEQAPVFPDGSIHYSYFLKGAPSSLHRVIVNYPRSLGISTKAYRLGELVPRREERDGMIRLVFEARNLDPEKDYESEAYLPPDVAVSPHLAISIGDSWEALANRYFKLVEERVSPAIRTGILPAPKPLPAEPLEKIRAITALLHREIRYTGVEFGESALVPQPPAVVLERKFGDCKDKSALLIAMLRAVGINAHFVLVNSSAGADVDPELPGVSGFNHAIVVAELPNGAGEVWIDATADLLPAGTLPASVQGRRALIARRGQRELAVTPQSSSLANITREVREFFLVEEGKARLVETTEVDGEFGWQYRSWFSTWNDEKGKENLQGYLKEEYATGELLRSEHSGPELVSQPAKLVIEAKDVQRGVSDVREAAVAVLQARILNKLPEILRMKEPEDAKDDSGKKLSVRRHDFLLSFPFVVEHEFRIHPPPGFQLRSLPKAEDISFGPMTLQLRYEREPDGVVMARLHFDTVKRRFTADEAREANKEILEFGKRPAQLIYFDHKGEMLLSKGDIPGALDEFEKLPFLGASPARTTQRRARALLAAGAGSASRELASSAVALEPDSAKANWLLGFVRQHDVLGRRHAFGYDRDGAISAFRKAHELDPEDDTIALDLAIQLEFNEEGERYTNFTELKEAVNLYREVIARGKSSDQYAINLMHCLARIRDFGALREFARARPVDATNLGFIALSTAMTDSAEAAIRELRSSSLAEGQRPVALQLAASLLIQLREYSASAALTREAAINSSASQQLLAQANLYSIVTRWERPEPPFADAVEFTKATINGLLTHALSAAEVIERLKVPLVPDSEIGGMAKDMETEIGSQALPLIKQGLPRAVAVDIGLAISTWSMDGNDQTGYRVTMRVPTPSATQSQTMLVWKGGKHGYRMTGVTASILGAAALEHLQSGNVPSARLMLEWAAELLREDGVVAGERPEPFLDLWDSKADESGLRLAAASLMAEREYEKYSAPLLEAALKEEADANRQRVLRQALGSIYVAAAKGDQAFAVMQLVVALGSPTLRELGIYCWAANNAGKPEECIAATEPLLNGSSRKQILYEFLAASAGQAADYEKVYEYAKQGSALRDSNPNAVNTAAWASLFLERDLPRSLAEMQKLMLGLPDANKGASLHTLAYIQAELGQTQEARRSAEQLLTVWSLREPNDSVWLLYGRIYENYGLFKEAREAYGRLKQLDQPNPLSSYELAQRRLRKLDAAPGN